MTAPTQIPGDPDSVDELARTLAEFARGMGEGAAKLGSIKAGEWHGKGGNAFRGIVGDQPAKFNTASDAFGQAQNALGTYADVLRTAQRDAGLAANQIGHADRATATWQEQTRSYNAAKNSAPHHKVAGPTPEPNDPGADDRVAAAKLLSDAQHRVEAAALRLIATLSAAEDGAPKIPSFMHRAVSGLTGMFTHNFGNTLIHVGEGMYDGVVDMGKGLWALTGAAVTDPSKFGRSWTGLLAIVGMPQARRSFARSFVDWNEWSTDPGRAFGHTTMNIASLFVGTEGILGKAGEGANAAKTTSSIGRTMSLDDLVRDVNPKYGSGPRYGHNCTHCVQATALRLRGVRTEARPLPKDLPEDEGRPLDVVEQPWATWFYRQSRAEIERSLLARGHGADGVVYV